MNCNCTNYQPIELSRKSVNKRARETKDILKTLVLLAENTEQRLKLFQCPVCGQYWQSGHTWGLGNKEYVFQVPEVEVEMWLKEPYTQPGSLMIYSAIMHNYYEQNSFEEGTNQCRAEGCAKNTVKLSAFCEHHHIEHLQSVGLLPKFPEGRLFPPYSLKE